MEKRQIMKNNEGMALKSQYEQLSNSNCIVNYLNFILSGSETHAEWDPCLCSKFIFSMRTEKAKVTLFWNTTIYFNIMLKLITFNLGSTSSVSESSTTILSKSTFSHPGFCLFFRRRGQLSAKNEQLLLRNTVLLI